VIQGCEAEATIAAALLVVEAGNCRRAQLLLIVVGRCVEWTVEEKVVRLPKVMEDAALNDSLGQTEQVT
jgi:hypothetical protein